MPKAIGYKSTLWLNATDDGSGNFSGSGTKLGGVVDGWEAEEETEMVDTTVLSMATKDFLPADTDLGDVSFEIAVDNSDSTLTTLETARDTGALIQLTEVLTNGLTDVTTGYVKTIGRTVKKREMVTKKFAVKVVG